SGRHREAGGRDRDRSRERGCGRLGQEHKMDFSRGELSDEDKAVRDEVRDFLTAHVTEEVRRRDRETGDNFDEGVHLALGAVGYLAREWKPESEGGFSRLHRRIWELEKRRA